MDDADPLRIPLGSVLSSDSNDFRDPLAASSSGVRTKIDDALSDDLCVGTAGGSLLSKSYGDDSQDACMYMENNLNSEHDGLDINDDEDDEGLYLAINSMPVKVEIEETTNFDGVKHEVDDFDYSRDTLDESSLLQEEEGIASTSGSEFCKAKLLPAVTDRKSNRKRRICKFKTHQRTEEEVDKIRQKNREQKQNKRRELQQKIIFETMYGIGSDSVYDIHEIEERKQRGEQITATEEVLLMKKRDRERQQRRRQNMTEDERMMERTKNRERKREKRQLEKQTLLETISSEMEEIEEKPSAKAKIREITEEKVYEKRLRDKEYRRNRRKRMSEDEIVTEKQKNRERKQKRRQVQKVYETFNAIMVNVIDSNI